MSGDVIHRLGMALGVVTVAGCWARSLGHARAARGTRRRLPGVLAVEASPGRRGFTVPKRAPGWLSCVAVAGAGWVLVGGLVGVGVGGTGGFALWWWHRRRAVSLDPAKARETAVAARQLPLAADLLAACIEAGAGPVTAARAVGETLGGPVGEALAHGAAEIRLGGEPGVAWQRLAALPGAGALARLLERADVSGLPMAGPVARIAAGTRAEWARAGTARARRAAVLVTAPVGLCFLPAFVAVGVLPVVIGLAGGVLGGGGA
ncbi:type II secretion system F family protein [Streptomyces sp. NPDC029526]|uniref:type II secretion system F family protein n=1 Tax=Streptomyces sp. NPDC029526 TaxID=3155728 RepID=UPI0033FB32C1